MFYNYLLDIIQFLYVFNFSFTLGIIKFIILLVKIKKFKKNGIKIYMDGK